MTQAICHIRRVRLKANGFAASQGFLFLRRHMLQMIAVINSAKAWSVTGAQHIAQRRAGPSVHFSSEV
jgi:hypothetical protein